ncbi:MAG: F0F1 ATP synthase subunit alpha, partial [Defluviitaleaceae bacterium]|nr:F0F1 ATP synthase subunit alpha [Defluviitaleaceae bacterium]
AMKKIAGPLRIELAQYRELAAFAQFGSDLSQDTLDRLRQGERIVEILKQPQYAPMPVEKQVLILYALTNKYLTDVYLEQARDFERDFLKFMDESHTDITDELKETGRISDALESKIKNALEKFKDKAAAG